MRIVMVAILILLGNEQPFAQSVWKNKKQKVSHAQGTLFGYWGYNRSVFSNSNIRFVGPGYDFALGGAQAHDNQTPFGATYFHPLKITVPQYNTRIGYYFKHHWALSVGHDHMKYILADQNEVTLSGRVNPGIDETGSWSGTYSGEQITTNRELFHYENSNGVNYLRAELTRTDMLLAFGQERQFVISSNLGVGLGGLISYNDFRFGGKESRKTISMSGYGVSGHLGLRFEFFRHVFFQTNLSTGLHHQMKVRTRANDPTSFARHLYGFAQFDAGLGFLLYLRPTNDCDSCPVW